MTGLLLLAGLIAGLVLLTTLAHEFTIWRIELALKDPSPAKRIAALDRLGAMRPRKTWHKEPFTLDDRSVAAMQGNWGTFAPPIMARGLRDQNPDVRMRAAFYLSSFRLLPERTLPVLTAFLSDEDEKRRAEAAERIGWFEGAAAPAAEALGRVLEDPSAAVRKNTANSLRRMGPDAKAALPALLRALLGPDEGMSRTAANAITGSADMAETTIDALNRSLAGSDPIERFDAAFALALIAGPSHVDKSAPDGFVSLFPAPEAVLPVLAGFLTAEDLVRRRRAADGLRMLHSRGASQIGALVAAMQDNGWPERWRAAYALDWMGKAGTDAIVEHKEVVIAALSAAQAASAPDEHKPYALKLLKRLQER